MEKTVLFYSYINTFPTREKVFGKKIFLDSVLFSQTKQKDE